VLARVTDTPLRTLTVPTAPSVVFYRQGVMALVLAESPSPMIHSFILRRLMPRLGKSTYVREMRELCGYICNMGGKLENRACFGVFFRKATSPSCRTRGKK